MFNELEQRSLLEKKSVQHPYIPFVYIHGKEYFCLEHPELNLNRNRAKQHIEGKKHKYNFDTGEPIVKTKSWPNELEKHTKTESESNPVQRLFDKLFPIFMMQDTPMAPLLAKHGLEDEELRDDVMEYLRVRLLSREWEEANKGK